MNKIVTPLMNLGSNQKFLFACNQSCEDIIRNFVSFITPMTKNKIPCAYDCSQEIPTSIHMWHIRIWDYLFLVSFSQVRYGKGPVLKIEQNL